MEDGTMHVDQEQKKKLLTVLAVILSLPVLAVAIWTILITILVSHAGMMVLILIISGCAVGYAASLIVAKIYQVSQTVLFHWKI